MKECCLKGFRWEEKPQGRNEKIAGLDTYVTGSNSHRAILLVHDLFGWTFDNTRLLADHYAEEADATVYIPDFFGGEIVPVDIILDPSQWGKINLPEFQKRNSKDVRGPEIFAVAKELRSKFKRVGAIGFCFGGWAIAQLGAKGNDLVDCVSTAHPSWLEKSEIDKIGVPIQIMAPEHDPMLTEELKTYCNKVIPTLGVPYAYEYFPGLEHAFATRGDPKNQAEREGMARAKNAAVYWFRQWLV